MPGCRHRSISKTPINGEFRMKHDDMLKIEALGSTRGAMIASD